MKTYIDILLVALVTIYIVDVSGFTESWRTALANFLHIKNMKPLPPFDCGKCMTWWVCIIYSICTGTFGLYTIAAAAILSHLSIPIGQLLIFIREWMLALINRLY